mmetsp:Transcript_7538/g.13646  ORF Transcript_7538/g.13646 Transcript_7538/m.13646 type:complete len:86 (+) Transcript_7538:1872-2129(+)
MFSSASVDFPSEKLAQIACATLDVDKELRPDIVHRQLSTSGRALIIKFQSIDRKSLRTAVCSLYDFLIVVVRTLAEFSEEDEEEM